MNKQDKHMPRRLSAKAYRDRWYIDKSVETIKNYLRAGKLPGGTDEGGGWFVWVNSDLTPAHDYDAPTVRVIADGPPPSVLSDSASEAANRILLGN